MSQSEVKACCEQLVVNPKSGRSFARAGEGDPDRSSAVVMEVVGREKGSHWRGCHILQVEEAWAGLVTCK